MANKTEQDKKLDKLEEDVKTFKQKLHAYRALTKRMQFIVKKLIKLRPRL